MSFARARWIVPVVAVVIAVAVLMGRCVAPWFGVAGGAPPHGGDADPATAGSENVSEERSPAVAGERASPAPGATGTARTGRADPATLSVTVRTADGRPVAGGVVVVIPIDAASGGHVESGAVVTRTDDAGTAHVVGLARDASHEICVRADGLVPTGRRFIAPGVAAADVTMRPIARHRVRLVDQDGAPLPGVRVTFTSGPRERSKSDPPELARIAEVTTGDDGWVEFAFDPSPAVEVRAWPDAPAGLPWHLGGALHGLPWSPGDDTLRVTRGWAIRGTVRTHDGKPLQGVAIRLRGTRGELLSPTSFPNGSFHVLSLDHGEAVGLRADVRCSTAPPDDAPGWTFFRGGDVGAELVVDPGAFVVVKLEYDHDATPAVLTWSPRAADAAEIVLDNHDFVLLGALDPTKTYTISWGPDWWGHVAVARDVVPDGRTVSLNRVPGVPTRGVVRTADGSPRAGEIAVGAWTADEPRVRVAEVRSKDDGTFEFDGLAPGRWVFRTSGVTDPWGEIEADAGAAKIEIRTNRSSHRPLKAGGTR